MRLVRGAAVTNRSHQSQEVRHGVERGLRVRATLLIRRPIRHARATGGDRAGHRVHVERFGREPFEVDVAADGQGLTLGELRRRGAVKAVDGRPLRLVADGRRWIAVAPLVDALLALAVERVGDGDVRERPDGEPLDPGGEEIEAHVVELGNEVTVAAEHLVVALAAVLGGPV